MEVGDRELLVEVAVIARDVFAEGVRNHLVHIDANDFASRSDGGVQAHREPPVPVPVAACSRSPAAQARGVSRRGSQNNIRPQLSQLKISSR